MVENKKETKQIEVERSEQEQHVKRRESARNKESGSDAESESFAAAFRVFGANLHLELHGEGSPMGLCVCLSGWVAYWVDSMFHF